MKRSWLVLLIAIVLAVALSACGSAVKEVELSLDINTNDGNFTISTPDNWLIYDMDVDDEDLVLAAWNNDTAYAQLYFFSYDVYDISIEGSLEDMKNYYGDNIIGDIEEKTVNDMPVYCFQYSMIDESEDGEDMNYHGYEYLVNTPKGVVEIDINYAQYIIEGKLFDPSDEELKLLQSIAESLSVN